MLRYVHLYFWRVSIIKRYHIIKYFVATQQGQFQSQLVVSLWNGTRFFCLARRVPGVKETCFIQTQPDCYE